MEALCLEVPVVASDARGNAELVADAGVVVRVGDIDAIARALDGMIDGPDAAIEMGRRGRRSMVDRYDTSILLARHDELYAAMLAERLDRAPRRGEERSTRSR
jgi:glycosyltransferase involved in cell wall biosynthesis